MYSGSCQCGAVKYSSTGNIIGLYICHCRECQKQSASAFGITLEVAKDGFCVTSGTPQYWNRATSGGRELKCAFCQICGSRLWHEYTSESNTISIKGGSLDSPLDVSNAIHVWTKQKLPGVIIPSNIEQFLEEPDG